MSDTIVSRGRGATGSLQNLIIRAAARHGAVVMNSTSCANGIVSLRMVDLAPLKCFRGSAVAPMVALKGKPLTRWPVFYFDEIGLRIAEQDVPHDFVARVAANLELIVQEIRTIKSTL